MTQVWLGIGSNLDPVDNLSACLDALLLQFRDLNLSSVFESPAAEQTGNPYLNMVAGLQTDLTLAELSEHLKLMERKQGRKASAGNIPIDIDILLYGNISGNFDGIILPRPEILTAPYVLWPLSQVAGKLKHPSNGKSYRELWEHFDKQVQNIKPVEFIWHGRKISSAK